MKENSFTSRDIIELKEHNLYRDNYTVKDALKKIEYKTELYNSSLELRGELLSVDSQILKIHERDGNEAEAKTCRENMKENNEIIKESVYQIDLLKRVSNFIKGFPGDMNIHSIEFNKGVYNVIK